MNIIETNFNYNSNHTVRDLSKIDRIILHHAAAKECSAEDIHRWHLARGFAGAGYNYLVRKDGSVYALRPINWAGAHCTNYNTCSIGICFEGNYEEETTMSEAQRQAGKELVAYIKQKYNINKVYKHKDLQATSCPGKNFPFDEIANVKPENKVPQNTEKNQVQRNQVVMNYQKAYNTVYSPKIGVDGIYGPETEASKRKVCLKRGMRNELVKWCQDRLINHKKYYIDKNGSDGIFGANTENVVKQFQKDNSLTVDGIIGVKTISILF